MDRGNYFWLLITVVLSFFGMIFMLPVDNSGLFIKELYFTMFLLIVAGIGLFAVANNIKQAWILFTVFFGINIFNTIFIYFAEPNNMSIFILLLLVLLIGFFMSVKRIEHPKKRFQKESPKTIIVDAVESSKKSANKKAAKKRKSTKKKAVKKTAKKTKATKKKSTKKKVAKKASKKTKTANKKTTKKKTNKKTTKKKSAKKKATKKKTASKRTSKR